MSQGRQAAPAEKPADRDKNLQLARIAEFIKSGDLANAQDGIRELSKDHGNVFDIVHISAVVALQNGKLGDAHRLFLEALELAPGAMQKASSTAGLAEVLLARGEPALAESQAKQALSLHRTNPDYYKLLARCYSHQGRVNEATALLRTTMAATQPSLHATFLCQIADILMGVGRAQDALPFMDVVLTRQPNDPDNLAQKAVLLSVTGKFEESSSLYRRAIELKPELPIYYALSKNGLDKDKHDIDLFESRLAETPSTQISLLTNLHFALATAYDDVGDVDRAYGHLEQGNKLKRGSLEYSETEERDSYTSISSFFNKEMLQKFAGKIPADTGVTPIFIVGMPRSGTTLVEQILGAHSQVKALGELPFMNIAAREMGRTWEVRARTTPSTDHELLNDFSKAARHYRAAVLDRNRGARFIIDKMPQNFRYLGLIEIMFPDALVIHCERNAMDTAFSCYQQLFETTNLPFSYDLRDIAGYYAIYRQYMDHWSNVLKLRWLNVGYEPLIGDLESHVRELLEYCGLPFEQACLEFNNADRTVLTASASQVRRPLYANSVEKWRRYDSHLGDLKRALDEHGFGPESASRSH